MRTIVCRFSYESSSEKEVVLIHVEIARRLQDFDTHLEAEEQFVDLEQTTTSVPADRVCLQMQHAVVFLMVRNETINE